MSTLKRHADAALPHDVSTKKRKVAHSNAVNDTVALGATPPISIEVIQADGITGPDAEMDVEVVAPPEENDTLSEPPSDDEDNKDDTTVTDNNDDSTAVAEAPARKTLLPPIQGAFIPWKARITTPGPNPFWGIKPVSGDPRPHADQPAARTSNAATKPSMWEDRTFRAKRGSRYVKYFGSIKPDDVDTLPDLDQETLLVLKLIDMRPKSRWDPTPRRTPIFYQYPNGKPKDWNDNQAIKCINDRRAQAIERMTMDAPWSPIERSYLAQIFKDYPDASIWEITERHNDRFKDKDFREDTTFSFTPLSDGRTVESVRHEYLLFKPLYDRGETPENVRNRADNSVAGKALRASKMMEKSFGLPDKALEKQWDKEHRAEDDEVVETAPRKRSAKAAKSALNKVADGAVKKATLKKKMSKKEMEARLNMAQQDKLDDSDEELLELAGAYDHNDEEDTSSLTAVPGSFYSPTSHDTTKSSTDDIEIEQAVEQIVGQIVQQAVAYANEQQPVEQKNAQPQKSFKAVAKALQNEVGAEATTAGPAERRPSLHAMRKTDIDENYDDVEDEEL